MRHFFGRNKETITDVEAERKKAISPSPTPAAQEQTVERTEEDEDTEDQDDDDKRKWIQLEGFYIFECDSDEDGNYDNVRCTICNGEFQEDEWDSFGQFYLYLELHEIKHCSRTRYLELSAKANQGDSQPEVAAIRTPLSSPPRQ